MRALRILGRDLFMTLRARAQAKLWEFLVIPELFTCDTLFRSSVRRGVKVSLDLLSTCDLLSSKLFLWLVVLSAGETANFSDLLGLTLLCEKARLLTFMLRLSLEV